MKNVTERDVGPIGQEFLEDVLFGQTAVVNLLREASKSGRFFVALRGNINIFDLRDLHEGGQKKKTNISQYFCRSVRDYTDGDMDNLSAYAFDPSARVTDIGSQDQSTILRTFACEDILYKIDISDLSMCPIYIDIIKSRCISFYFVLMLFKCSNEKIEDLIRVGDKKAEEYLHMFMINAFDQDGVFLWRRS